MVFLVFKYFLVPSICIGSFYLITFGIVNFVFFFKYYEKYHDFCVKNDIHVFIMTTDVIHVDINHLDTCGFTLIFFWFLISSKMEVCTVPSILLNNLNSCIPFVVF